jgi:hypothetical protein
MASGSARGCCLQGENEWSARWAEDEGRSVSRMDCLGRRSALERGEEARASAGYTRARAADPGVRVRGRPWLLGRGEGSTAGGR